MLGFRSLDGDVGIRLNGAFRDYRSLWFVGVLRSRIWSLSSRILGFQGLRASTPSRVRLESTLSYALPPSEDFVETLGLS